MNFNTLIDGSVQDSLASIILFAPELVVCGTVLALLGSRLLPFGEKLQPLAPIITMVGMAIALVLNFQGFSVGSSPETTCELFGGMLVYDSFTVYVRALLFLFTILFVVMMFFTQTISSDDGVDYYCLVVGAILGMCLMASANHLLMIFLAVEMASVPSYALAGILRGQKPASEASLKYSIYGAGAAGVMLYGISLLAGITNAVHLPTLTIRLVEMLPEMQRPEIVVLVLGSLMVTAGLAFKLSAVPFHFWCPDVFEGATAEIGAFLSIASKAAALALLVRVCFGFGFIPDAPRIAAGDLPRGETVAPQDGEEESSSSQQEIARAATTTSPDRVGFFAVADTATAEANVEETKADTRAATVKSIRNYIALLVGLLSIVSMTFGNMAAYGQTNIKRLMAYSTIAHAGYMMLPVPAALVLLNVSPESASNALSAVLLYVFIYMFMNLGAFSIIAFLQKSLGTEEIEDFSGMIAKAPVLVICLALIMFSLVGLPPLAGFVGKFALFASLADAYVKTNSMLMMWLLVIGGINTAISLFYYLNVVKVMVIRPESDRLSKQPAAFLGWMPVVFVTILTLPIVFIILGWTQLSDWSLVATSQLFG